MYDSFEFNGLNSKDLGIFIVSFDGLKSGNVSSGDTIEFQTSKGARNERNIYHGYKRDNPMTITFSIGKFNCKDFDNYAFTREECAHVKRWLCRKDGYKLLKFDKEEFDDTLFFAKLDLEWRVYGEDIVGADITATCDAPYGYSHIQTVKSNVTSDDDHQLNIFNDSDEFGSIEFSEIIIEITSGSTVEIKNEMDNKFVINDNYNDITQIKNCVPGEVITIKNHQITSTHSSNHTENSIIEDFNFIYPHLINLPDSYDFDEDYPIYSDEGSQNKITINGFIGIITFKFRTIRSVTPV